MTRRKLRGRTISSCLRFQINTVVIVKRKTCPTILFIPKLKQSLRRQPKEELFFVLNEKNVTSLFYVSFLLYVALSLLDAEVNLCDVYAKTRSHNSM